MSFLSLPRGDSERFSSNPDGDTTVIPAIDSISPYTFARSGVLPLFLVLFLIGFLTGKLFAEPAACGEDAERSPRLEAALALYEQGWHGDDRALLEALDLFETMRSSSAASPVVRAYFGSACLARARMVSDREKPRWLRRGAKELDDAVEAAPENPQVRLLRARSMAILPRMAGRMETVEDDYDWLIDQAEGDSSLDPVCRQAIYYHAGAFAMRNRDHRGLCWLRRAAEPGPIGGVVWQRLHRMLRYAENEFSRQEGSAKQ